MNFKVTGTGSFVPDKVLTNEDLSRMVDTSDEWIIQRVGVSQRRICTTETTADLAFNAAKLALESSGTRPSELDLIIVATISGDNICPAVACEVQALLGASCPSFDISAACSGFLFALETAACYFARGNAKKILVIGADQMSRITDWDDRNTCVIFGDGAGAFLLEAGENYMASKLFTKGDDSVIKLPAGAGKSPFSEKKPDLPYVHMQGQETFKFAVGKMVDDINEVLSIANVNKENIKYVVPHQANIRIIQFAAKKLCMDKEKFFVNIDKYGNTSAASIPMAVDELNRQGRLKHDDLLVLSAFGGGLSSAACVIRW
jgi:3-oxoacyl-[acyl-carrier-protein] synthase-3